MDLQQALQVVGVESEYLYAGSAFLLGVTGVLLAGAVRALFKKEPPRPPREVILGDSARQILALVNDPAVVWKVEEKSIHHTNNAGNLNLCRAGKLWPTLSRPGVTKRDDVTRYPGLTEDEVAVINKAAEQRVHADKKREQEALTRAFLLEEEKRAS